MAKVLTINKEDGSHHGYLVYCPGCKFGHLFDKRWAFNGDMEKPTFRASYLSYGTESDPRQPRCHSYVTDGKIKFLPDCTHELAGQTVELPEFGTVDESEFDKLSDDD